MILMGNRKVVWEGEGREAFPYPDYFVLDKKHFSLEMIFFRQKSHGVTSTVNQTGIRRLVNNIIRYLSGGHSI